MIGCLFPLCWTALSFALPAEEVSKYKISLQRWPAPGKVVTIEYECHLNTWKKRDVFGKALQIQNGNSGGSEMAYTMTILEGPVAAPQKIERKYTKAVIGESSDPLAIQGRTLVFENKFGVYILQNPGDPPLPESETEKEEAEVNRGFTCKLTTLFPSGSVKVGESWDIDPIVILQSWCGSKLRDVTDLDKSSSRGKLVRVYKKDDRQFGVIEVEASLVVKEITDARVLGKPLATDIRISADFVIDGSGTEMKIAQKTIFCGTIVEQLEGSTQNIEVFAQTSIQYTRSGER